MSLILYIFFFFQAEDGIRDVAVTGVQTCALPIFIRAMSTDSTYINFSIDVVNEAMTEGVRSVQIMTAPWPDFTLRIDRVTRSEERRVGKECRSRWSPYH